MALVYVAKSALKLKVTSNTFISAIAVIAEKIRARHMRPIYFLNPPNLSGCRGKKTSVHTPYQAPVIPKAFVSTVARLYPIHK